MKSLLICVLLVAGVAGVPAAAAQTYTTDPASLAQPIRDGDRSILEPRGLSLFDPMDQQNVLKPTIKILNQQQLGYDLEFTFRNDTSQTMRQGRVLVGVLTLGEHITYLDDSRGTALRETTWDQFVGTGWRYPGTAYSPVCTLMNDDYAVGISMLYPIMEYKHDVLVRIIKAGGVFKGPSESRGWIVAFDFQNQQSSNLYTTLPYEAVLKPGEEHRYILAVRAMRRENTATHPNDAQEWLETLRPYRDYFQSTYGGVQYTRHPKPVHGRELANEGAIGIQNPRGLLGGVNRPDRVGFAGLAQEIASPNGYSREMLWAPSGVNSHHRYLNFPSQFTLGWLDIEKMRTATDSIGLPRIQQAGKELGLWWGRSAEFTDHWDASTSVHLDPNNPEHLTTVFRQLDLAKNAGATCIGLDDFVHHKMPIWEQVPYLKLLRERYPQMTFVTEPMNADIVHAVAPTFLRGFRAPKDGTKEEDYHFIRSPHYLADLLLPGHETWAYFRYSEITRVENKRITPERIQRDAQRLAGFGYVTAMVNPIHLPDENRATAKETWLTTIPQDLQQPKDDSGETDAPDAEQPPGEAKTDNGSGVVPPENKDDSGVSGKSDVVFTVALPSGKRLRIKIPSKN